MVKKGKGALSDDYIEDFREFMTESPYMDLRTVAREARQHQRAASDICGGRQRASPAPDLHDALGALQGGADVAARTP